MMSWMSKKIGMELWEESKNKGQGWKQTLLKLEQKLLSPMPPRKNKKRAKPVANHWNVGDVYAYDFNYDGFGNNTEVKVGNVERESFGVTNTCTSSESGKTYYNDYSYDDNGNISKITLKENPTTYRGKTLE